MGSGRSRSIIFVFTAKFSVEYCRIFQNNQENFRSLLDIIESPSLIGNNAKCSEQLGSKDY